MEVGCLRSVAPDLHNGILDNLHKLSFTSMSGPSQEVPGTRHHFTEGGRLVASKQIVYRVDTAGLDPVIIMLLLILKIFFEVHKYYFQVYRYFLPHSVPECGLEILKT